MVKIAVITGSSASGLACLQRLLLTSTSPHSIITQVRGGFRRQGKAATFRSSLPLQGLPPKLYEAVSGVDATDTDSLRRALEGMDRALLVTPLDYRAGLQDDALKSIRMIQAAQEVGVQRIVHIGSWTVRAPDELPILSARFAPTEEYLKSSSCQDLEWTVLRGGYFMSNFGHVHAASIQTNQSLLPVPDCFIPPVDVEDIGEAAAALLGGDHEETYVTDYKHAFVECCGPELLSHGDIAAKLSAGLETSIDYSPLEVKDWSSENPVMSELYHYMAQGDGKQLPFDPQPFTKIIGRPLTTLTEWAAYNKQAFL